MPNTGLRLTGLPSGFRYAKVPVFADNRAGFVVCSLTAKNGQNHSVAARCGRKGRSLMEHSRKANAWAAVVMAVMLTGLFFSAESPAASLTSVVSSMPGYDAEAVAISADGSTVAGTLTENAVESHAFIWTTAGGMQTIGSFGAYHSDAYDISSDGTTLVGSSLSDSDNKYYPFKWTAGGGMANLGSFGGDYATAYGVSADGSVIVGGADDASGDSAPFRWTEAGGMQAIGTFGPYKRAAGVSDDGTVAVVVDYNEMKTFRWTAASGLVDIGTLGGNYCWDSYISGDGTTIVGASENSHGENCLFRWTEETGMVNLAPTGSFNGQILGISADGSVIVGGANDAAFLWTQATGVLNLRSVLESQGVDVGEWGLFYANDVTILPDGSCSIVGRGGYSLGSTSFVANLIVPEPATIVLLTAGGIALLRRREK
jgi:probable HAF family extracellular repeat protein